MLRYWIIIEYIVDQLDLWLDYHDVESLDMFEPRNWTSGFMNAAMENMAHLLMNKITGKKT